MDKIVGGVMGLTFVAFIGLMFTPVFVSGIGATNGTHQGHVTALETNSFIVTNHKAYVKTSKDTTQEDQYCVKDPAVYEKLQAAVDSGERVNIKFAHPMIEWVWNCSGEPAIITDVQPLSE